MARMTVSTDLVRRLYRLAMDDNLPALRADLLRLAIRAETAEGQEAAAIRAKAIADARPVGYLELGPDGFNLVMDEGV